MARHQIALLPGDGIGPEVLDAAMVVLDAVDLDADYHHGDIGWSFWCQEGNPLPARTVDLLNKCSCALFGAITSKTNEEAQQELKPSLRGQGLVYRSPILSLRQMYDLYVSLRPCVAFPGNPLNYKDDISLVVFRENTEGLYAGIEFFPVADELRACLRDHNQRLARFDHVPGEEMAISLRIITHGGAERIVRRAFEYARRSGHPKVTLVEKANVLRETSGLMLQQARKVAADYPGIELEVTNIDAQMMWLLKDPHHYGVMVTSNLFGDILSDLCAQLVGGLGFTPSGNIGDNFAIFEPSHGSAPKYAGQQVANPIAMILSAAMMLEWLGEMDKAEAVRQAVAAVIADGKLRTRDMGGTTRTMEMASEIARRVK